MDSIADQAGVLLASVTAYRVAADRAINSAVAFADTLADAIADEIELPASYGITRIAGRWVLTSATGQVELTYGHLFGDQAIGLAQHIQAGWLNDVAALLAERAHLGETSADVLAEVAADFLAGIEAGQRIHG